MHSGYSSLIRYFLIFAKIFANIFPPFYVVSFHFLDVIVCSTEVLNFLFFFLLLILGDTSQKPLPSPRSQRLIEMF